ATAAVSTPPRPPPDALPISRRDGRRRRPLPPQAAPAFDHLPAGGARAGPLAEVVPPVRGPSGRERHGGGSARPPPGRRGRRPHGSEGHTSELQSRENIVCRR